VDEAEAVGGDEKATFVMAWGSNGTFQLGTHGKAASSIFDPEEEEREKDPVLKKRLLEEAMMNPKPMKTPSDKIGSGGGGLRVSDLEQGFRQRSWRRL
jgi:hypothetical protein